MPKGPTSSKPARPKTHKPRAVPAAAESEAGPSIVPTQNGGGKSAMDDIFSSFAPKREQRDAARQQQAAAAEEAAAAASAAAKRAKKRKRDKVIDPVFGEEYDLDRAVDPQNAKVHRHDSSSGLRVSLALPTAPHSSLAASEAIAASRIAVPAQVYKAHDLGLGRGGGTPLCPFDCKCCF